MQHVLLTKDLGQKLMIDGYSHFILALNNHNGEIRNPEALLTLEPSKDLTQSKVLPINQLISLPEDKLQKIYVRLDD